MKLGQKVRFKKYLRKNNYCNWCSENLDKDFDYQKYDTIKLGKEKEGIVCGKRVISYRGYTYQDEYGWHHVSLEKKVIVLVANNMMGFYRVPEEWLEEVNPFEELIPKEKIELITKGLKSGTTIIDEFAEWVGEKGMRLNNE